MRRLVLIGILAAPVLIAPDFLARADSQPFRITVLDDESGRGVPLVELRTVNNIRLVTDSAGVVAFDEPGLMDQPVFFTVQSHGYEFPKDGFGYRGMTLTVRPGGEATLKIKRLNLAQRLYRVTGAGIYRDTLLAGGKPPLREPVINGLVFGSDSVVNVVYRDKIHWFWGDTNRPAYPLGNYHVPGATSELPSSGGLDPKQGVDLSYFVDDKGFVRPTAQMPGEGPTWIDGLVVLKEEGRERMFAAFVKVKPPLEIYQRGLAEFDGQTNSFRKFKEFDRDAPLVPGGHPFVLRDGNTEHVYFSRPYPLVRVRAEAASLANLSEYEAYSCLHPETRLKDSKIDRAPDGKVRYSWKRNTPAVGPAEQAKLIAGRHLRADEALVQLRDRDSGKSVNAHGGSVYWNPFRRRWVMITVEAGGGTSYLGEVWYAEADTPLGPWAYAVKIVTHDRYSFYNPKQHPMFDERNGRTIFFEGTYTHTFSGNTDQTPRYDYNQIMYQLDLDNPLVALPVAAYQQSESAPDRFSFRAAKSDVDAAGSPDLEKIAFFALDQPGVDSVAIYESTTAAGHPCLKVDHPPATDPAKRRFQFHALYAAAKNPPPATIPLYEYVDRARDKRAYSTDPALALPGFQREKQHFCRVWRNPWHSVSSP